MGLDLEPFMFLLKPLPKVFIAPHSQTLQHHLTRIPIDTCPH